MLRHAKREVPSLELGPPSPSWMDQLAGSPLGDLKPTARSEAPKSLSPRYETTWVQLPPPEETCSAILAPESSLIRSLSSEFSRETAAASLSSQAGTASCVSLKRAKSPSKRVAKKRRRVVPSGEAVIELEKWSAGLTADALSETFLAPSTMDVERDVTEEFMNEFWGDLMKDSSPISNDSLLAAASPLHELHTPLPADLAGDQPDGRLLDDVTEDQLLELAEFLEPVLPEVAAPAPALAEMPPMAPAAATSEAAAAPPIDLAALLEETEIVFSPERAQEPAAPLPSPAPAPSPPAPVTAEPTHYLLVLPAPERRQAAAPPTPSATSESTDDPAERDSARWTSTSTSDAEVEVEVVRTASQPRKRAPRRPPAATPAEKYRRIRDNNNEASRRSRQQRKQREVDTQLRAEELEAENARLRERVDVLEGLLDRVKALAPLLTARK